MNLEDIAKKAGVSRATVSRVINNAPNVNANTREQVWEIIRKENFQPDPAARALVRRKTEIVGVVVPTEENIFFTDNNYFTQILAGVSQVTRERDYGMLLWLGEMMDDERLMQKVSNNRQMDGIIFASVTHDHPLFKRLLNLKGPFVMIDRPLEYDDCFSYVTVDNVEAGENATSHLISLGRRRIAHITGHPDISDARDRLQGYKNALIKAGMPIDENLIVQSHFNRQKGYDAAMPLLRDHKPDAIFAAGDTIAIGAIQAAHEAGLRVPEDVAVIGFDDVDVASQAFPALSTVRQPVREKGAAAARLLLDLIENRVQGPQHLVLQTELVIRDSCGARLAQRALS
jgi:LacI family transcriptional regulator